MVRRLHLVVLLVLSLGFSACQGLAPSPGTPTPELLQENTPSPAAGYDPTSLLITPNTATFTNQNAQGDQFVLSMQGVPPAAAGQVYVVWLTAPDGTLMNLGTLPVDAEYNAYFQWTSPTGENLLDRYRGFKVSIETESDIQAPSETIMFAGEMQPETWDNVQQMFVGTSGEITTPGNIPLVPGLQAQTRLASEHVGYAAETSDLPQIRANLEQVINILEGQDGPRFQDYDGNGTALNPGDGFGVKGYANRIVELIGSDTAATGGQVIDEQINLIQNQAEMIIALEDAAQIQAELETLESNMQVLENLIDQLALLAARQMEIQVTALQ